VTQHRCTEELRQLREDASHETTSRTKHWGSPSKNQALGEHSACPEQFLAPPRGLHKVHEPPSLAIRVGVGPPEKRCDIYNCNYGSKRKF